MTFQDRQLSSMSLQAWIMKLLNLMAPMSPVKSVYVILRTVAKKRVITIPLGGCN